MKITIVKSKQLTNTEYFEFLKQMAAIIKKYDADTLKIKTVMDALLAFFDHLQAGLDKEKSNQLTKVLNELDQKRDVLIVDFTHWLEVMQRFPDDVVAPKAQAMYHYLVGFGKDIANQTMLSETTILTNIVDGFTKDSNRSAALAAINGTKWITALGAVNTEFASQYGNRVADTSNNNKVESFSNIRNRTNMYYNDVVNLLTSRYTNDKADNKDLTVYENCIADLNQLIAQVNILAEISKPKPPKVDTNEVK